ncbi:HlyD family efflux transporter periplasmic adaptor subunit [Sediminibacillus dalangtanensis]|uniref:HlyD family efflux transporter periplasmic adaptor subunit n=1 Tax=Sediminibacillus dalangtanensis TaxID=2729421 RepID=A0ABX7VRB2_9BACI|nr:HlyD family secretion protein [Sediminibacillus dalangtanensis]QTM98105.1 HlyD family efflux transporter periplasmic adaptor subunit [Sediminibacillus dalangtanensis]
MLRKKAKKRIVVPAILLFIGINILLVIFDADQTVDKKSYVKQWTQVFTHDLYHTSSTEGILTPAEDTPVYFDDDQGRFLQFLVEKGEHVQTGDGLFEYQVSDYQETEAQLQQQTEQLEEEIAAIENAIAQINAYQFSESETMPSSLPSSLAPFGPDTTSNTDSAAETETDIESDSSSAEEAKYLKEQYIAEKQIELAEKQAALNNAQSQLAELAAGGDTVTIESPVAGIVTELNQSLANPLTVVSSEELIIEGTLPEGKRKMIEQGMEVRISIPDAAIQLNGTIQSLADVPEQDNEKKQSDYHFEIEFNEEPDQNNEGGITEELTGETNGQTTEEEDTVAEPEETLLAGYHADLEIITEQELDSAAVFTRQLAKDKLIPSLWVLNENGRLELRPIELGLNMDVYQGIASGASTGEWIVDSEKGYQQAGTQFVTPIKENLVPWRQIFHRNEGTFKPVSFLTGIVSR